MSLKDILKKKIKVGLKTAGELDYIERLRTGIAGLDVILGGGLPKGRVIQIWGSESVGKSSLCLSIIKGILDEDPEAEAIYVDAERTINKGDIEAHNLDSDRLVFFDAFGGEEAIDTVLEAFSAGAKIGVVDSVPYLRPAKVLQEIEKNAAYRDVSSIALLMERVQHKIVRTLQNTDGTLIFINQERPPKSMYEAPGYPGGSALRFMLSCSIHITSAKKDKDNPGHISQNLLVRKNKTFTPLLRGEIPLQHRVVQLSQSLVETCAKHDIIRVKGGGYYELYEESAKKFNLDIKLGRGLPAVVEVFKTNPDLADALYKELLDKTCQPAHHYFEEEDNGDIIDEDDL